MNAKKGILSLCLATYLFNAAGCGVLLYPERQGQEGGKIDPVVALLNGVGLLLYVVPGLVAFAVDFHQGTIYLPNGPLSDAGSDAMEGRTVKIDGPMTKENIEAALKEETGLVVDLSDENVQAVDITHKRDALIPTIARAQSNTALF